LASFENLGKIAAKAAFCVGLAYGISQALTTLSGVNFPHHFRWQSRAWERRKKRKWHGIALLSIRFLSSISFSFAGRLDSMSTG
jgi:hypothetical protein